MKVTTPTFAPYGSIQSTSHPVAVEKDALDVQDGCPNVLRQGLNGNSTRVSLGDLIDVGMGQGRDVTIICLPIQRRIERWYTMSVPEFLRLVIFQK